ncbi:winged helix-turn-helix transcriptional regulator [Streptomyces sp. A30]|uniref:winged helix-turn-helix transcriptional regulator n=1 Tax=Streptomyces sp. A30 TaxID=2789273 RepID=UPI0039816EB1
MTRSPVRSGGVASDAIRGSFPLPTCPNSAFRPLDQPARTVGSDHLQTLRAMERDGLLTRTAYDENPPRVEYALTPLGRTLIPLPRLLAARHAHRRNAA